MPLQVIGTGFGRTGTNSLKLALEQLGFDPCHHMFEVRDNPRQLSYWQRAARGEQLDWQEVFSQYAASLDWPSVRYWKEICACFPKAKVLHSVRDEHAWIKSVHNTIYPAMLEMHTEQPGARLDRLKMAHEIVVNQTFDGRLDDEVYARSVYLAHTEEVRATIPAQRLLVFDVVQGWGPLCEFLEVSVPDAPFPRANSTEQFHQRPR